MLGWTPDSIKQWVRWMQFLDRWGYITACLSFLLVGMLVFGYSWFAYVQSVEKAFLPATIALLNDLLFASVRRILTAGAEFSHQDNIPEEVFRHYLMDMGLHVMVILVLMIALFLLKKTEQPVEPLLTK